MRAYDDLHPQLKTGDLVLFSGKSRFSRIIRFVFGGKWSHVGLVLVEPRIHPEPLLWESTNLCDVPDVEHGVVQPGIQLVSMRERISRYDGEVTVRQLSRTIEDQRIERLRARHLEPARAVYDGPGGASRRDDLNTIYCAELVAEAYQAMGLLPEWPDGLPSNEYVPLDFSEGRTLRLRAGFELGPEVPVTLA